MQRTLVMLAAAATGIVITVPAAAQEFGLYLLCSGTVEAKGKVLPAHLDLAMRRNNGTALIQRSDVLPVGERMKFETSPAFYSMVFLAPMRGSVVYHDWIRGALFVWNPDLQKMHSVRLSVDRQSAALQGEMRDGQGTILGRLKMKCQPKDNDSVESPKF
jgi:hypothetical protein